MKLPDRFRVELIVDRYVDGVYVSTSDRLGLTSGARAVRTVRDQLIEELCQSFCMDFELPDGEHLGNCGDPLITREDCLASERRRLAELCALKFPGDQSEEPEKPEVSEGPAAFDLIEKVELAESKQV